MLPPFTLPGLFVTGTDTGVGKTTVSCAILRACRKAGFGVVPFKPLVSGQAADGTFEDIENLRQASGMQLTDAQISPLRFVPPVAPAVAAQSMGQGVDWSAVATRIEALNQAKQPVLVEGVGGLLAPLEEADFPGPRVSDSRCDHRESETLGPGKTQAYTCRELIQDLALPVLVVARTGLGTLSHTAMTVELLRASGASIAGIVMNGGDEREVAVTSNRAWIEKMTGVEVLAVVPMGDERQVDDAMALADWEAYFK